VKPDFRLSTSKGDPGAVGHSSITVKLDRYRHLLPNLNVEVADGLERAHHAALEGRLK
jgi:hypothetical protein